MVFFLIYDWIDIYWYDKLIIGNLWVIVKIILFFKEFLSLVNFEEKILIILKINNGEINKKIV